MPENEFEKQVQQKMDELKLKPSDEVWQKVAVAIAKRKGDRRIFAIVFLLLLFIGSSIFIIWDQTSDRKINKAISEKNNPAKTNNINDRISDSNTQQIVGAANSPKTGRKDSAGDRMKIIKDITVTKKNGNQQKPAPVFVPVKTTTLVALDEPGNNNTVDPKDAKDDVHNNTNKVNYKTRQKVSMLISNNNPVDLANETIGSNDTCKTIVEEIIPVINDVAIKGRVIDSVSKDRFDIKEHVSDTLAVILKTDYKKDASVKRSMQLKQKREWKIGFSFSLGVVATQNGLLGIIGSGNNDESGLYSSATQSTGATPGQGSYISYVPSKIKAGAGLVLGVFVQKNISPKTNFLFGLNYKTYSSGMMIGNRVDSGNNFSRDNFFYRSGNQNRYKNHFHFVELPVALRFKLGKQNKVPVYLNSGVTISQLVGSNALQFDTLSGAYYSNNAVFNKTQVNVSAGLLFSLSGHAKNPFLIGPDINFSLNKMANSGLYKNRHYSYFGILVQKRIGKK